MGVIYVFINKYGKYKHLLQNEAQDSCLKKIYLAAQLALASF